MRGPRTREKDGSQYFIVVCEDDNAYQCEFTAGDSKRFAEVYRLQKGERYRFPVVVVANRDYQFARLGEGPIYHLTPDGELEEL